MLQTSNYNLNKPEGSDTVDISVLNANFDTIDTTMKTLDNRTAPYVITSGTANAYTATINGISSYTAGMRVCVQINTTSTGASTLNINGLGAKTILDSLGNAISNGGLKANIPYQLCYNGSNFIVLGKGGGGDATSDQILNGKKATVDSGQIVGTMPNNGAVSSTLTNNNQEYIIPAGFHNGLGKIKAIITNLAASVIKAGTTVGGIVGTFTSDATAVAADIINGKTAYVNGNKITGNATIESLGGMNVATGTAISSTDGQEYTTSDGRNSGGYYITVTGLAFMPSIIICYYGNSNTGNTVVYTNQSGIIKAFPISSGYTGNWFFTTASPTSITSTGFSIPIGNISTVSNKTYTWIALG